MVRDRSSKFLLPTARWEPIGGVPMNLPYIVAACLGLAICASAQAPLGTVQGRVLGPDGEPMVNVEVTARQGTREERILARARTDGDGIFLLTRVAAERGVYLLAQAPGHTTGWGYADLGVDRLLGADELRLWQANTVRGRIVDGEGKPVADACVVATKDFHFWNNVIMPDTRTDADGRFVLPGVPIGDIELRVYAPGFLLAEHTFSTDGDTEVQVPPLQRGKGTTLTVETNGVPAEQLAQARVSIDASRGGSGFDLPACVERPQLGVDGRLRLEGLPDIEWQITVLAPGLVFEPRSVAAKAGDRDIVARFTATPIGSVVLRGTLRDLAGEVLPGQTLLCRTQRWNGLEAEPAGRAVTAADGRFELTAPAFVDEPVFFLLANSVWALQQPQPVGQSRRPHAADMVRWTETADPRRDYDLRAAPASRVTATLLGRDQRPLPFVVARLEHGSETAARAISDRDGIVRFAGVHAGEQLRVIATDVGGAGGSEPFAMAPGQSTNVQVTLESPSRVVGRAVDADGKPLAGITVSLRNWDMAKNQQADGGWTNVPTNRQGRFVFTGVSPGGHYVEVGLHRRSDGKGRCEPFEVASGATADVEVRVAR